ncbi:MAG: membrane protease subunit [Proteobacteria bacterium]|nr:membrane protease subunit [Pseudomonadota bacterium]
MLGILFIVFIIGLGMWGFPQYSVYKQSLYGQAELAQAEWNRQILIEEAKAKEIAAVSWARAEVERAKGAAEANQIVAEYLGGPEAYLRWLFIEQLSEIKGQIIYLPTEAGLPMLEAGKR